MQGGPRWHPVRRAHCSPLEAGAVTGVDAVRQPTRLLDRADVSGRSRHQSPALVRPPPDILIAEDELLLREALQDALEASGHRVAVARNGQEALRLLDRLGRPALIVLDLQMPIMDGVTFLAELRKRHDFTDFHVLAMSAVVNEEWLQHVPGVLRTLQKPFDVQEIISVADAFASGLPSSRKPPAIPSEQHTPPHRPDPNAPDVPPEQSSAIRAPPGHEAGSGAE